MTRQEIQIKILWKISHVAGSIEVANGTLLEVETYSESDQIHNGRFEIHSVSNVCSLNLLVQRSLSDKTIVTIHDPLPQNSFCFFLTDVNPLHPVYLPALSAVITLGSDTRSFTQIVSQIKKRARQTGIEQIMNRQEASYAEAALTARKMTCPTLLGISRDYRNFSIDFRGVGTSIWDSVIPLRHMKRIGSDPFISNKNDLGYNDVLMYCFRTGRGMGCCESITRRLIKGYLPILKACIDDEAVQYQVHCFVSLERGSLDPDHHRGTHYLAAADCSAGSSFSADEKAILETIRKKEFHREEETVFFFRAEAENTADYPAYAFFHTATPGSRYYFNEKGHQFDGSTGFGIYPSTGKIYQVSMLNGKPMPSEETAILLMPGQKATFDFFIPHQPIDPRRAAALARQDFGMKLQECVRFWESKLAAAGRIDVPEPVINEMLKAGLLHLDIACYGLEPNEPVLPTVGVYSAIGSESSPIIQFFDCMGWHSLAERALQSFLERQQDNGMISTYVGYMLETGAILYTLGEHYRYTRNQDWVHRIRNNVVKACEFQIQWMKNNENSTLINRGYGLIDGKTSDPEDPYHSFMLNGYAYLGFNRAAELLQDTDPDYAQTADGYAKLLLSRIRAAVFHAITRSPLVPLADGSWYPALPPWPEYRGAVCLGAEGGVWDSHSTNMVRDSLNGPLWLVFQEVIDPCEPVAKMLLDVHQNLMTQRNVGFAQPYYCRHDWVHLKRGEVKAFLMDYYYSFCSLADRQTYSFWEHYYHASPHKTHEEAWFLMQTRWMLYLEDGDTLCLLPGVPSAWLAPGNKIIVENVSSYFGMISFCVQSDPDSNQIQAQIRCEASGKPARICLRLPCPDITDTVSAKGGQYDNKAQCLWIDPFEGAAKVSLSWE